jgi:hypothetical protein
VLPLSCLSSILNDMCCNGSSVKALKIRTCVAEEERDLVSFGGKPMLFDG